jgi:hypothetical protein
MERMPATYNFSNQGSFFQSTSARPACSCIFFLSLGSRYCKFVVVLLRRLMDDGLTSTFRCSKVKAPASSTATCVQDMLGRRANAPPLRNGPSRLNRAVNVTMPAYPNDAQIQRVNALRVSNSYGGLFYLELIHLNRTSKA